MNVIDAHITQTFEEFVDNPSHLRTAKFFLIEESRKYLVSAYVGDKHKIYKWNEETMLYEKITENKLACIIQDTIVNSKIAKEQIHTFEVGVKEGRGKRKKNKKGFDGEDSKEVKELLRAISNIKFSLTKAESITFCEKVVKIVINEIEDKEFLLKLDKDPDVVNFINGYVDLRTGRYRSRKFGQHFFSKTLNYEYRSKSDHGDLAKNHPEELEKLKKAVKFVNTMYFNIANNNSEDYHCVKEYLGYCMTGHVNRQVCLAFSGSSGSNGKTIIIETFEKAMSIYVKKMDNKTFDDGYTKNHKQLNEMKGKRLGYIEELKKTKMDMSFFKDFIGGNHISNEIMYSTVEDITITSKLVLITNNTLRFEPDGGIERRGRLVECTNRFITEKEYKKLKDKKGFYIKDEDLLSKFDKDRYKLAIFHALLPYAMKHYEKGNKLFVYDIVEIGEDTENNKDLIILDTPKLLEKHIVSTKLHKAWKEICGINDTMAEFLDLYYEKGTDKDIIGKDTFLKEYRKFTELKNLAFPTVLSDIKKHGYKYDSQRRCNGERGVIIGLKRNDTKFKHQQVMVHFDSSEEGLGEELAKDEK